MTTDPSFSFVYFTRESCPSNKWAMLEIYFLVSTSPSLLTPTCYCFLSISGSQSRSVKYLCSLPGPRKAKLVKSLSLSLSSNR